MKPLLNSMHQTPAHPTTTPPTEKNTTNRLTEVYSEAVDADPLQNLHRSLWSIVEGRHNKVALTLCIVSIVCDALVLSGIGRIARAAGSCKYKGSVEAVLLLSNSKCARSQMCKEPAMCHPNHTHRLMTNSNHAANCITEHRSQTATDIPRTLFVQRAKCKVSSCSIDRVCGVRYQTVLILADLCCPQSPDSNDKNQAAAQTAGSHVWQQNLT